MDKKLKILLIRPKYHKLVANLEPLGLEYIVGLCNELNIECDIFDEFQRPWLFRTRRLIREIKKGRYNFIGFNANASSVDYIIESASAIKKELSDVKVWVGGPEVEVNYEEFCTEDIDFIYHDNGLETLKNMLEGNLELEVLKKQKGICYKDNEKWIVIKEKSEPSNGFIVKPDRSEFYKYLNKNFIFLKGSYALSKASFSCPFNCKFCYCTKMNSGKYTEIGIDEVIEEIESINHPRIWLVDDTFFFNKERVKCFCEKIIEKGIKKQFMAYARADFLANNPDILPLAYEAGFRDIMVGLEAITDDQLDEYNKRTSRDENVLAIKHLLDNNIVCIGCFVLSHKSTKQDFKDLIKFIKENNLLWVIFGIFTPYKGSDAYEEYKDQVKGMKSKKFDGMHITIKPENMSVFMFKLRYLWLHLLTYPKIGVRTLFKSAYDTKKRGWF